MTALAAQILAAPPSAARILLRLAGPADLRDIKAACYRPGRRHTHVVPGRASLAVLAARRTNNLRLGPVVHQLRARHIGPVQGAMACRESVHEVALAYRDAHDSEMEPAWAENDPRVIEVEA